MRVDPRKPGASGQAVGRVLVKEKALLDQGLLAELEELARDVLMARTVQRVRDQGAIAWPGIRIGVAGELRDVQVRGRDDRALVVLVRARPQDASPLHLRATRAH